ncbi:MAG: NAD(P)-dependent oxidoreductase, partial [Nitrospira sp.]
MGCRFLKSHLHDGGSFSDTKPFVRNGSHVMVANPGFPLVLDVRNWPVLVIGGDEEASEKSQRLLESGARVTVISPTLNEPLRLL